MANRDDEIRLMSYDEWIAAGEPRLSSSFDESGATEADVDGAPMYDDDMDDDG